MDSSPKHEYSAITAFQICINFLILWNAEDMLKVFLSTIKVVLHPINFNWMDTNIFQNIFFSVLQKKVSHKGLELYAGE